MSPRLETVSAGAVSLQPSTAQGSSQVDAAYRVCRAIARREARNFYYAFLALPAAKHNAICAVYAFMRHADDLSDDESLPRATRRENLRQWREAWHTAADGGVFDDPVFVALNDARVRYGISLDLLDKLIDGTAMDLDPALDGRDVGGLATYANFDQLYRYCYLVASVVGLVCIRIFEYANPEAEQLAEELGIAFQLTNILRDVREDAERGRVYLPLEDLASHGVDAEALATITTAPAGSVRALLAEEAERAERFYASGRLLLPMIAADSRPALWVLMTIYHRLLQRIGRARYDVFSARVSVPAYEKFAILGRGLLGIARYRLFGG